MCWRKAWDNKYVIRRKRMNFRLRRLTLLKKEAAVSHDSDRKPSRITELQQPLMKPLSLSTVTSKKLIRLGQLAQHKAYRASMTTEPIYHNNPKKSRT